MWSKFSCFISWRRFCCIKGMARKKTSLISGLILFFYSGDRSRIRLDSVSNMGFGCIYTITITKGLSQDCLEVKDSWYIRSETNHPNPTLSTAKLLKRSQFGCPLAEGTIEGQQSLTLKDYRILHRTYRTQRKVGSVLPAASDSYLSADVWAAL